MYLWHLEDAVLPHNVPKRWPVDLSRDIPSWNTPSSLIPTTYWQLPYPRSHLLGIRQVPDSWTITGILRAMIGGHRVTWTSWQANSTLYDHPRQCYRHCIHAPRAIPIWYTGVVPLQCLSAECPSSTVSDEHVFASRYLGYVWDRRPTNDHFLDLRSHSVYTRGWQWLSAGKKCLGREHC